MSSPLRLQALPLPSRILPKLSIHVTTTTSHNVIFHHPCASPKCLPTLDATLDTSRATAPGARRLSCIAPCAPFSSSSSSSTMDGACTKPPPMYRANVGICLINDHNKVFVAQQLDVPGAWQMPQGGIDGDEDPQAAAFRELKEETGVTSAKYLGEVPEWLTYDFPPEVKAKLSRLWGTEWNGQAQKWFLFKFTGNEREINLLGDGSKSPEFFEWKWVPVEDVVKHVVEFKKQVYEEAFKHLVKLMK